MRVKRVAGHLWRGGRRSSGRRLGFAIRVVGRRQLSEVTVRFFLVGDEFRFSAGCQGRRISPPSSGSGVRRRGWPLWPPAGHVTARRSRNPRVGPGPHGFGNRCPVLLRGSHRRCSLVIAARAWRKAHSAGRIGTSAPGLGPSRSRRGASRTSAGRLRRWCGRRGSVPVETKSRRRWQRRRREQHGHPLGLPHPNSGHFFASH